jgi:hypothetical protein
LTGAPNANTEQKSLTRILGDLVASCSSRDIVEAVNTFEQLDLSEKLLIWGIRSWVACCKARICPMAPLRHVFCRYGITDAAASLDALLSITVQSAVRPINVHCPKCSQLSPDEVCALQATAAAQSYEFEAAQAHLEIWLGEAANMALGPLCGLGALFRDAGLDLPHRPATQSATPQADPVSYMAPSFTLH